MADRTQPEAPAQPTPLALVFTDMVGSSAAKRAASLGHDTSTRDGAYLDTIQSRHLRLVRDCIAVHGGSEIMTMGDAFFLTFADVHAALLCCAEIQMRLKAQPIMMPSGRMQLRIGIHVGTPKFFEQSWHGTDVDTAARAEAEASPEQIVVTQAAHAHLAHMPGIVLRPLGTFALKGIGNVPLWDADYDDHGPRQPKGPSLEQQRIHKRQRNLRLAAFSALALALGALAWFGISRRPPHAITDKDRIVLAEFDNKTGDPVFEGTLRQGMTVQLEQSPFLSLISDESVRKTLTLMGQPPDTRLTPAVGREICQRTGSAAVLDGSIAALGNQYVLGLRAISCRNGEVLDAEQVQAARKEDVLNALSQIAGRFRTRIGESLATVQGHDRPLEEVTTPSLEALQAYGEAAHSIAATGGTAALPFLKHALEIDPKFAMAQAMLGRLYADFGESALAAQTAATAYRLRDRASDRERFFIDASYQILATGNLEQAKRICEAWAQTYPRDERATGFLSGMIYPFEGRFEQGSQAAIQSIDSNPDVAFSYVNLAYNKQSLEQFADEAAILDRAEKHGLQTADVLGLRYQMAFLRRDQPGMDAVSVMARQSGFEDILAVQEAFALSYSGHLQQSRLAAARAVNLAGQSGQRERAGIFQAGTAVREALLGDAPAARQAAAAALLLSNGREVQYGAAFALLVAGDTRRGQALTDDLQTRFPQDSMVRFDYAPTLRALIALARHDPARAVDLLQISLPFELGIPQSEFPGLYGLLYPVYVRGLAYLALKRGADAVAEFQKILTHPGIVVSDNVGAVSRLQIARAYVLAGDPLRAKAAYQDLLTLWSSADPGLPLLTQASAEYLKL